MTANLSEIFRVFISEAGFRTKRREASKADEFEKLLSECRGAVERFVYFKLKSKADADDVLQEVFIAAYKKFDALLDKDNFKAWLVSIARNKWRDYYRDAARRLEIPFDDIGFERLSCKREGLTVVRTVRETIGGLEDFDRQILGLYYLSEIPQSEIASRLNIPLGTVKSRLYRAKNNFKAKYPYPPKTKGDKLMTKLPEKLPEYTIKATGKTPFDVTFEELSNWFIIPRTGEKISWASYDMPSREKTEEVYSETTGKILLHGIEGVEIKSVFTDKSGGSTEHYYMAQLTDTHCRWLGERYFDKEGVQHYLTFLDGDDFLEEWGFGDNNCGVETKLSAKGQIKRVTGGFEIEERKHCIDVVGSYDVIIGGKEYHTLLAVEYFTDGALTQQYIGSDGRTVLWRRFNRNDWKWKANEGRKWSELFPENERISIGGDTYVHWYDCITDRVI